jgi:hypothetical protein
MPMKKEWYSLLPFFFSVFFLLPIYCFFFFFAFVVSFFSFGLPQVASLTTGRLWLRR